MAYVFVVSADAGTQEVKQLFVVPPPSTAPRPPACKRKRLAHVPLPLYVSMNATSQGTIKDHITSRMDRPTSSQQGCRALMP